MTANLKLIKLKRRNRFLLVHLLIDFKGSLLLAANKHGRGRYNNELVGLWLSNKWHGKQGCLIHLNMYYLFMPHLNTKRGVLNYFLN